MSVLVEFSPVALDDVWTITLWWIQNRPAAENLFRNELDEAVALLSMFPEVGNLRRHRQIKGLRCVVLRESKYHLYYTFDGSSVSVARVWSAVRGRGPKFK